SRERAHAEEELTRAVWLRDVVVYARLEGRDTLLLRVLLAQNDEERRGARPLAADRPGELEPADVGERELEDDDLRARGACDRERGRAARCGLDVVAGARERARQGGADRRISVDDEHADHPDMKPSDPSRTHDRRATSR